MTKMDLKQEIDYELSGMKVSDALKSKIYTGSYDNAKSYGFYRISRTAAALLVIFCLTATTAFAGYNIYNRLSVNHEVLPELDAMKVVNMTPLNVEADNDGWIEKDYGSYKELKDKLGIPLLDSTEAVDNPYMQCHISTDNKDDAVITVDNYILGDTSNYEYSTEDKCYFYEKGSEYFTPVSLTVSMILSQEQLEHGWDVEYLGYYEFAENYVSANGYKVNILEDTVEEPSGDYVSEKLAVFVADGVQYTVKGRTSLENIKRIVDSMKFYI